MEADSKRQIKIKSGMVKRITREYESYEQEIKKDKERINKLREAEADEHDLRKQEEVLQESISMLPNTKRRLQEAHEELKNLMKELDSIEELTSSEEWQEATEILTRAETQVLGDVVVAQ